MGQVCLVPAFRIPKQRLCGCRFRPVRAGADRGVTKSDFLSIQCGGTLGLCLCVGADVDGFGGVAA